MVLVLAAVLVTAAAMPLVVVWGLRGLAEPPVASPRLIWLAGSLAGVVAGSGAALAARGAGSNWWLPGLVCWAVAVAGCAVCDAATQRVPTRLVAAGAAASVTLLVLAVLVTRSWREGLLTLGAVALAAVSVAILWRFAGAGFGDVRLAALGGLGLGHATIGGVGAGLLAFCLLTLIQAGWTLARTRNRHAMIAYGPGLAVFFLVAAAA